jgi:ABC-type phosphate transport system substrate-binding protein
MKTHFKSIILAGIFFLTTIAVFGESPESITISTNGSKFVAPLLEKWTQEYQKEHPGVAFNIVDKTDNASLSVVVSQAEDNVQSDKAVAFTGRYALLPVSHPGNPIVKSSKGLSKKDLKNILFEKDIYDESEPQKDKYQVNVYTRISNQGGTSIVLAHFFDAEPNRIKGKKVYGDEAFVLKAIVKDSAGIAYTNLNYVFNLSTRKLKPELSLLPLNIKSRQKERLYSADVDQVINLLETENIDLIPVTTFGFVLEKGNAGEAASFVQWILDNGQQFNHELGFLQLDENTLTAQQTQLKDKRYASVSLK